MMTMMVVAKMTMPMMMVMIMLMMMIMMLMMTMTTWVRVSPANASALAVGTSPRVGQRELGSGLHHDFVDDDDYDNYGDYNDYDDNDMKWGSVNWELSFIMIITSMPNTEYKIRKIDSG